LAGLNKERYIIIMQFKSILAIGAHPDDLELSCFGFLAKMQKSGSKINAFIVSPDSFSGKLLPYRIEESKQSFNLLPDVNLILRYKNDIKEQNYSELSDQIRQLVIDNGIDTVLVHYNKDTMQEHRLLHEITLTALRRLAVSVIQYRSISSYDFISNMMVDISNEYDIKKEAIKKHISQKDKPYMSDKSIETFNKNWNAESVGIKYCEEFNILRMVG
jgi:LmbE family N-acetylglucosaminyl deacetylase